MVVCNDCHQEFKIEVIDEDGKMYFVCPNCGKIYIIQIK